MFSLLLAALVHCGTCQLQVDPHLVVVRYGDAVSVNCSTTEDHAGIGWEAPEGAKDLETDVQYLTWEVQSLTEWSIKPICFINTVTGQSKISLPVIVYKTPDSVSISAMNHSGPLVEDMQYELQCDIQNVAPLQNLTVKWYKGQMPLKSETFNDSSVTPVNVSSTLLITPSRADDGAQYRCEAELELGAEGPQPPPSVTSQPLHITVHYAPQVLPVQKRVLVRKGKDVYLSCNATGNPPPVIKWSSRNQTHAPIQTPSGQQSHLRIVGATSTNAGVYTCTATNKLGSQERTILVDVEGEQMFDHYWQYLYLLVLLPLLVILLALCIWRRRQRRGLYRIPSTGMQLTLVSTNGSP